MSFSIAGSPSRFAPSLRLALASLCGCIIGAGNACNVYTPEMLTTSGAGGVYVTGGQPSTGGVSSGGSGYGGIVTGGTGGRLPSGSGGAALGGVSPASGGHEAIGGAANTSGTSGVATGGQTSTSNGGTLATTGGIASGGALPATGGAPSATGGAPLATGGAPPVTGGTSGIVTGGSAGTIGSGGVSGTGGAIVVCDATVVDDMHDKGSAILVCDERSGTWFSFGADPTLVPVPAPKGTFSKTDTTAADRAVIGTMFKAELSGSTADTNSCGMGFSLKAFNGVKQPYSLAGRKLSFKYRTTGIANGNLVLAIPIMATVPTLQDGSCASNCYNHYFVQLDSTNGQWSVTKEISIVQGDGKTGFMQAQWGDNGASLVKWDPTQALVVQFAVSGLSAPYTLEVGPIKLLAQ